MFQYFPIASCHIAADDTFNFSAQTHNAVNIISNLQIALSELKAYFDKWKIMINPEKTQTIYFTRKRNARFIPQQPITFMNIDIPWENNVKYLGVILDTKVNFYCHIPYIINKINKLIRVLYPLINRKLDTEYREQETLLLNLFFHPVMFYCAPSLVVFRKMSHKKVQIAQNKLLKMVFKLPWHSLLDVT
ncbi:putative RNA-directed DNA polymerase from transposon BS [Lucilia cuprina]|nr:putative RNA-directed DNA polymerase from transposon BS [Lucilia cuprina]